MSKNMRWKDSLFSSSLPLEFDAAKILVNKGFGIQFDYTYKRYDDKEEKDFSIDINADNFYPFEPDSTIQQVNNCLVECKYRNPNVKWLFLPDINNDIFHQSNSRTALKLVDEFSTVCFESRLGFLVEHETCLKGVEIKIQSGEVHDRGILHGGYQLLYGTSVLLRNKISFVLNGVLEDAFPFLICPILLTTADLYIAENDFSINSLTYSDELENFSYKVDCLKFHITIPPSFQHHSTNLFNKIITNENYLNNYNYFKGLRKTTLEDINQMDVMKSSPEDFLNNLLNGFEKDFFQEIIICSLSYFPTLIDKIKNNIEHLNQRKKFLKQ